MFCACGFEGVELWFLRLDGGRGLSEFCRECQQSPAYKRQYFAVDVCQYCGNRGAYSYRVIKQERKRLHLKCISKAEAA